MTPHAGSRRRIARSVVAAILFVVAADARAGVEGCSAEIVLRDSDGGTPRVGLTLRVLDGAGSSHERSLGSTVHRIEFEELSCGPSTVEVYLPADPDRWILPKPVRLARRMFEFDEHGHAVVEVTIVPIRRVRCRVVDRFGRPVGGGVVNAFPLGRDGISTMAVGARIGDDGLGELLLTKGRHHLWYRDDANYLTEATAIDGEAPKTDFLEVGDSERSIVFEVTRPAPTVAVKGQIVDPEGAGVEGIEIETTEERPSATTSDDGGRFILEVPAHPKRITLRASDSETRWVFDPVTFDVGRAHDDITWVAKPWPGPRIRARVIASDSGEPIVRAHLMADLDCLDKAPTRLVSILTDEQGDVAIPCSPGCPLTVDLYPYWSESPEYFAEQGIAVPGNACGDSWTIPLERGATLSGRVVDAQGHGISDLDLKLVQAGDAPTTEWTTGSDGSYSFHPLLPGRYEVRIHEVLEWGQDRFLYLAGKGRPIVPLPVVEIGERENVKLDIVAVTGGKLCARGVQIPNAPNPWPVTWLHVVRADGAGATSGRVYDLRDNRSLEGGCTLGLPVGDWRFLAGTPASEGSFVIPAWSPFGESVQLPSYTVRPGERTIVEVLPGQLAGGVAVRLRDRNPTIMAPLHLEIAQSRERKAGTVQWVPVPPERYRMAEGPGGDTRVFAMLPVGEYELRLRVGDPEDTESTAWVSESSVTVAAGETAEVTLERSGSDPW